MPKINLADVVCWGNDQGKILCPECLEKEFPDYPSDWTPIFSPDEKEAIYECDMCEKRIVN